MRLPTDCRLSIEDEPARTDRKFIDDALNRMNVPQFGGAAFARFGVFVRGADETIRAGLDGLLEGGWLFVNNLWVEEALRRSGVGTVPVREAERIAAERGCHSAWLDTFSFQAPLFYQKLGYEVFGTLDYPPKNKRYFLRRKLV
jgi:GNAT superfamily N-acetyltransferase